MNKLEELIQKLCPNGVKYKPLNNVVKSISTGLNPRKNFTLNIEGATNFYVTVKEITTGKIVFSDKTDKITDEALNIIQDRSNLESGDILLSGIGTIGKVALVDIPLGNWNCSESVFLIKPKNDVITSAFLAYILGSKNVQKFFQEKARGSTLKGIRQQDLKLLKVPVPPIEVQEEIVRILDKFTELSAELTAELTARKKQYEFYRDNILNFSNCNDVPKHKLTEIFNTRNGYTPSKNNKQFWNTSEISWFRMDDIRENGRILDKAIQGVSISAVKGKPFPKNSIIVSTSATIGEHALIKCESLANQRFTYLMLKDEYKDKYNIMFLFCYCFVLDEYCKENLNQGNFASVDMRKFNEFEFPMPSLEEQNRIVAILDRFDKLCNDISEGLPAEIEARQKQYEYYRDKLLTFEEIAQ